MAAARAPIRLHSLSGVSVTPMQHGKEEVSMAYKAGALLIDDAGQLEECGADPAKVLGVALTKATGVENSDVPYIKNMPGVQFEASIDNSGTLGLGVIAATDLHVHYGVALDAAGIWYVDKAETTVDVFEVVGFVGAIGEVMGRVIVQFVPMSEV